MEGDRNEGSGKQVKAGESMQGYKGLKVYEKSYQLALRVYQDTKQMPREEMYGLTSQI